MKHAGLVVAFAFNTGSGLLAQAPANFRESPFLRIDPARIVITDSKGNKPCGECHTSEWDVWRQTKHATGFDTMHRSDAALGFMKDLDLRVTKRQAAVCMRCHYTVGPDLKAIAGVSCESCHGPARDWVNVHNKWGDGARNKSLETPASREARVAASRAAGMLRPSTDVYGITANCFECHTVPVEDIVNRGGHSTGSAGFDLVKRVNEVRHNFLQAGKSGATNRPMTVDQTRAMFVIGRILGYEYSLRGLANATSAGRYSNAMARRVKDASRELEEIASTAQVAGVGDILKVGTKARLVPNNRAELESAAQQIRALGQRFALTVNGATLAALDPLIAGQRRAPAPQRAEAASVAQVSGSAPQAAGAAPGSRTQSPAQKGTSAAAAAAAPARVDMPGQIRSRPAWFTGAGRSGMVGAGKCTKCHAEAEDWWFADPHQTAGKRIFGENPKARQIADLYGIGAAGMVRPDKICLTCHATIDEASKAIVEEGVSCESCHGAGGDFLKPHENGGNPQKGMKALKRAPDRAQNCSGCHQMSDERLIAAGHPSGASYDFAKSNEKIKHWPGRKPDAGRAKRHEPAYAAIAGDALRSAYASAVAGRPIPKVAIVAPPLPARPARQSSASPAPAGSSDARASAAAAPARANEPSTTPVSIAPRVPGTVPQRANASTLGLQVAPMPAGSERLTTEELLLLVKQRIERLYAALGRGN